MHPEGCKAGGEKIKTYAFGGRSALIFKLQFKLVVICLLCLSFYTCCQRFCGMKRLGERAVFLSTDTES